MDDKLQLAHHRQPSQRLRSLALVTPAYEVVGVEWVVGFVEDGHRQAGVQEQRLDEHPSRVGDR